MENNLFVQRFLRLHPDFKGIFGDKAKEFGNQYYSVQIQHDDSGKAWFEYCASHSEPFIVKETSNGYQIFMDAPMRRYLISEAIFDADALCRKDFDCYGNPKFTFLHKKQDGCIQEEIYHRTKRVERSVYRPHRSTPIDFPPIKVEGHWNMDLTGDNSYEPISYKISFPDNCTRSTYDEKGNLIRQEIHKEGKIVHIQPNRNIVEKLLRLPKAKISYADTSSKIRRQKLLETKRAARS